ncbi:hypothetical protein CCM_05637 [Cordyceps militaris CM01]|uniref:Uncharacterized protein n=1 Tax=Cordyceps militaris (strain CM01) TaxID=983644 RepID=G3JKP0_CORMM|nr:uncharacterized protein CCM_05637 [Cordyceps militaris CM01]EGX91479.1 hypothetical protein CCM_05637 [Cordyceps militaris CM01]
MDADSLFSFIPIHEAAEIWARLHHVCGPNNLVLSSEIGAFSANCWAEERGHKTFETALSPLLERLNPRSKGYCKTPDQWINYQNGASIMFTLYISTGTETVVLTRPPPVRLRARSSYKELEECWITACCEKDKFKIFFAHPLVNAAQDYIYEYWPEDHINAWMTMYPERGKLQNLNVLWESTAEQPTYRPNDLRQMRDTILKKLYLHTTGASLYWNGSSNAFETPAFGRRKLHENWEQAAGSGDRERKLREETNFVHRRSTLKM